MVHLNKAIIFSPVLALLSAIWLLVIVLPLSLILAIGEVINSFIKKTPSQSYHPEKILITGAASGIGEALALVYARTASASDPPRRLFLALLDVNEVTLLRVAEACRGHGAEVETRVISVTDVAAMDAYLLELDERVGGLDLVHANAGVIPSTVFSENKSDARVTTIKQRIDGVIAVNGNGCYNTVTPLLERFRERGHGHIAITASLAAYYLPYPALAYGSSKAMVYRFARDLARVMRPYDVTVTAICPWFVTTGMTRSVRAENPNFNLREVGVMEAAKIIERGIYDKDEVIAFPTTWYLFTWFVRITPDSVVGGVYDWATSKRLVDWRRVG
ncbi:hypothetical protein BC937DRAFT_92383 [Endogone sp. FLAS-F59071]|nr:hypothetical protein BC937DRAFT_92383 [Endogone sp. FLAS-F59071]|eukprot:RUS15488.1 hypothetical protein BC937DRAFT_92383 [Endogone sp. FLAS-F59071]